MRLEHALAYVKGLRGTKRSLTIARSSEGEHAYQIRFVPSRDPELREREPRGVRVEARRWVDQTPTIATPSPTSARGTVGPFVGWARWSTFLGFSVAAVLADDWEFVGVLPEDG